MAKAATYLKDILAQVRADHGGKNTTNALNEFIDGIK